MDQKENVCSKQPLSLAEEGDPNHALHGPIYTNCRKAKAKCWCQREKTPLGEAGDQASGLPARSYFQDWMAVKQVCLL